MATKKSIGLQLEEKILEPYGITVEEIADANGYQSEIRNPAFDVAVGEDGEVTDNGEPEIISNTETRTEFVARKIPEIGLVKMIENVMRPKIALAEKALIELRSQPAIIAAQMVKSITKTIVE